MSARQKDNPFESLPGAAAEYIGLVIRKMGYRRKVRADVEAELVAHFEDALRDCKTAEERDAKARQVIEGFGDAKLLGVLMRRAKKRCRPAWKKALIRSFQAAGILVVALTGYTVWFLLGEAVVTTDYVAQLNELARPDVPGELNSRPVYEQAFELYVPPPEGLKDFPDWPGDMTAEQRAAEQDWVDQNSDALAKFTEAAHRPYYWQKYESDTGEMLKILLPNLSEFRKLAKALCRRAMMRAQQGETEAALEEILTCYRAGAQIRTGQTLIDQLVGISLQALATYRAFTVLANSEVSVDLLAAFHLRFKSLCANQGELIHFDAERLSLYDEIQRCFTAGPGGHIIPRRLTALGGLQSGDLELHEALYHAPYVLFAHPDKHETRLQGKEVYDYYDRISGMTPYELKQAGIDTDADIASLVEGNILLQILGPALDRVCELAQRQKCNEEALLTTLAVLRYRQERGSYPQELSVLVEAGYIYKLPNDPYSAGALVYKRLDGDFTLYSFGADFDDDGGLASKWGQGDEGGDQVFWPVGTED